MKHALIVFLFVALCGCTHPNAPQFGQDETYVPKQFRNAVGWRFTGSQYSLYIDAYHEGYWVCIRNYVSDINYTSALSDKTMNGYGAKVGGFANGYDKAESEVLENIERFGKERTHRALVEWWDGI